MMNNSINNRGPILTGETTLAELQKAGVNKLSDISLSDLLNFVRSQALETAIDMNEHGEWDVSNIYNAVSNSTQEALDHLDRHIRR